MKNLIKIYLALFFCLFASEANSQFYASSKKHKFISKSPLTYSEVKYDGVIRVNNSDTDIEFISDGGYLEIMRTNFGITRRIRLEGLENGVIERYYFESRRQVEFEPEGRRWLNDILLDVVRSVGLDAEGRVKRFYKLGGVDEVLEEIEEISSSSGMRSYFTALLNMNMDDTEISQIGREIPDLMSSNTEIGRLYVDNANIFLRSDEASIGLFRGVGEMSSNSEMGYVLKNCLKKDLSRKQQILFCQAVTKMSSNSEMARSLRAIHPQLHEDPEVFEGYFEAIDDMSSNYEISKTLNDLLRSDLPKTKILDHVFRSTANLSSDHEMGALLKSSAQYMTEANDAYNGYFEVISSISSNSEIGGALVVFIEEAEQTKESMVMLLNAVGRNMDSNSEMAEVLITWIKKQNVDDDMIFSAYYEAIGEMSSNSEIGNVLRQTINQNLREKRVIQLIELTKIMDSDAEMGRVLLHIINSNNMTNRMTISLLGATSRMSSSSEIGHIMTNLAKTMSRDQEIVNAYRNAANALSSDSEYRRVMDALLMDRE